MFTYYAYVIMLYMTQMYSSKGKRGLGVLEDTWNTEDAIRELRQW